MAQQRKLGFFGLAALVFGAVIGSGIFNIAQNMAAGAGAGAVIIAWLITAAGMVLLVWAFKMLSERRPDLNAGIYQYAQVGFGNYVGFNIAWGYWLCAAFGNVAYSLMLNDAIGVFYPPLLEHGWQAVALCSVLLWSMFMLVINGMQSASFINTVISILKFGCLGLVIVLLIIYFKWPTFHSNLWSGLVNLGSMTDQVKSTMLVTLWCFLGIEGAVVMAARAQRPSDVGKAGVFGFFLAWILYVLVSVLCYGVMAQPEMAHLENPSIAYVLRGVCGDWAYYFIILAVIVSLLGGWVAWTLMCAQVPYEAAQVRIMPQQFVRVNSKQVPIYSLLVSSVIQEIFVIMIMTANSVYLAAIEITGMMVLPAYLFTGLFLWRASYDKEKYLRLKRDVSPMPYRIVGIGCTLYCLWLMYAGGLDKLMCTSLFYIPGVYFYVIAQRQARRNGEVYPHDRMFSRADKCVFWGLCALGVVSLWQLYRMYFG